jgi:glutamyl-tRNA synthetase
MDGLKWLGLDWDEGPDKEGDFGPYRQSERVCLYRQYAEQLINEGKAYREENALIFKIQHGIDSSFDDIVYGRIESISDSLQKIGTDELKDIVMIKGDGMPTYNYACVIDDHLMKITHIIRGEDHISNTPKQVLIYRALGWEPPKFAHLPMILGKDKKKLSKRHGATSIYDYRDMGYMPESVFNFLALLGWSPGGDKEIFSRSEAVDLFSLERVIRKPAVFDFDKLNHINQAHLKHISPMERLALVKPFWMVIGLPVKDHSDEYLADALALMSGRGQTAKGMAEYSDYFVSFEPVKARYNAPDMAEEQLKNIRSFCNEILSSPEWKHETLEEIARNWAERYNVKMKECAMPLRFALTGMSVSPGIFEVAVLFGREETRRRLEYYKFL